MCPCDLDVNCGQHDPNAEQDAMLYLLPGVQRKLMREEVYG